MRIGTIVPGFLGYPVPEHDETDVASAAPTGCRRNALATAYCGVLFAVITAPASAQIEVEPTYANGEVSVIVEFEVKPGLQSELETHLRGSTACSRLEPGNVTFDIHHIVGEDRRYVLYEVWRTPDALRAHFERPYTKALFAAFDRMLTEPLTRGGLRFIADLRPEPRCASESVAGPDIAPHCR